MAHLPPTTSRRSFLKSTLAKTTLAATAALAAGLPFRSKAAAHAAFQQQAPDFSFVVLGDLHLDRLEHHDMDWLRREKPNDVRQVENYSRITAENTPILFAEVRQRLAALPGSPFILQLGDLVEGLCGNPALARKHCQDAVATVQDARLGAPLLFTKGNHDIAGPGAREAFDEVLFPAFTHPAIHSRSGANYALDVGPARFVIFDAYKADASVDWLTTALAGRNPDQGPLFFVIHPPVIPYTARCWHIFERPEQAEKRARLLALLSAHRAIVLNGHLHRFGLLGRTAPAHPLTQFSVNSVIPEPDPKPRHQLQGAAAYGPDLTQQEPNFNPDSLARRRQSLAAEQPHITSYAQADVPGYAILHVRGQHVTADYHRGLNNPIWQSLTISTKS